MNSLLLKMLLSIHQVLSLKSDMNVKGSHDNQIVQSMDQKSTSLIHGTVIHSNKQLLALLLKDDTNLVLSFLG